MNNGFKMNLKRKEWTERLISETTIYISAGGRGKRLESIFQKSENGITKALIEFNGKTLIQYHTDILFKIGFKKIIIWAGDHLCIKKYYEDKPQDWLVIFNSEL
ncbi:MAG: hypothetical protein ACD_2C00005G0002 [uncultured bacterium (gcode 4)]|uniref:MobA-like NTP transferase domain-containing protein n=1 Tax=uncultured bacterium (gcode 4) TaxID=1234023 RepID=K2G7G7_9BACT|nr:MAG: hypothetical protein ACD_2C00005G0002 [uncultured bacterium (gcode 4)]